MRRRPWSAARAISMLGVEVYNLAIQSLAWGDAAAVATVLFFLIAGSVLLMTRDRRRRQAQGDLPMNPTGKGKVAALGLDDPGLHLHPRRR